MKRIDLYKNLTKYANLILLSQGESDPLVIKEAMMSGLGIVISESSSHMIDRNEDFIDIIPEERINDKNYIQVVIEENRRKSVLRREYIREYTLKKYSWKILVKKYIENIQKILY